MIITIQPEAPDTSEPVHPFDLNSMVGSAILISAILAVVIGEIAKKPRHHDRHDLY